MITETAPAKLNLYLHVGPVRDDGLHALESLFVFTEDGDVITVEPSISLTLKIEGPYASALAGLPASDNLVFKAAELLKRECAVSDGATITLQKNLPIAAGVGGGSADAAAALRALIKLWRVDIDDTRLEELAFSLGADVPACLKRAPVQVSGAGETLAGGPSLPPLWACLVNPGVAMPTGPVFKAYDAAHPSPADPKAAPLAGDSYENVRALMAASRNDLEAPAVKIAPVVGDVLDALALAPDVLAARMSGSGATCFGLFPKREAAFSAAKIMRDKGWWAMASAISTG